LEKRAHGGSLSWKRKDLGRAAKALPHKGRRGDERRGARCKKDADPPTNQQKAKLAEDQYLSNPVEEKKDKIHAGYFKREKEA